MRTLPGMLLAMIALAVVATAQAGVPVVSEAWARATPPGVEVGAAYMVITGGDKADRLVGASSTRAAMVDLHVVEERDGVATMRAVDAVPIPAGQRVALAPNATHLMLMGLDGALVAGQRFEITLRFAESGTQSVTVVVRPAIATDDHAGHRH